MRTHAKDRRLARSMVMGAGAAVLSLALATGASVASDESTGGDSVRSGAQERQEIGWVIDSALARPHLRGAEVSVIVESRAGRTVFERGADTPMIPASNMKLVTAAAALSLLGPHYRFETTLLTDAPGVGATLDGNLYVQGSGDPSIVTEELWKIAESVRVLGIERVNGDLILDSTYFDTLATTSPVVSNGDRAYHARTGALSLNFNSIAVHTRPGASPGDPAVAVLAPDAPEVELRNDAVTCSPGRSSTLSVRRSFENGSNVITVSGRVPLSSNARVHYRSLDDAEGYFGSMLKRFLGAQGVAVSGAVRRGRVPGEAMFLSVHRSKPLSLIVRDLNKFSNNFVAEQLLKAMSAHASGRPGTTAGGVGAVEGYLLSRGVEPGSFVIRDGSGFSRDNRLSTRAIAEVIRSALSDFGVSYEFACSLSVSGTDGTLEDRMGYPALESSVRAKTGLLDGVTAISGLVEDERGEEMVFSIMINGFECEAWRAHDLEHAILAVIRAGRAASGDGAGDAGPVDGG
jgi:D-alanyl-D-alanine carboxypeptidase/D-alanyl-D-alanine-endopeptidase (penicillin-binding protein 4)